MLKFTETYGKKVDLIELTNNSKEEAVESLNQAREAMNSCVAFMLNPAIAIHLNEFLYDKLLLQIRDCSQGLYLSEESLKGGSSVIGLEAAREESSSKILS